MSNKNFSLNIVVLLCLIAIASSCRPKQTITTASPEIIPVNALLVDVRNHEFKPQWFSGKASVTYTADNKSQNFNANIRMKRDSIIWASVSPGLGIEVARIIITPDTLLILNRIEQSYLQTGFNHLNKILHSNLQFSHLQALLLGNYPEYVENSPINNVAVEGNDYILSAILKPGERHEHDVLETLWVHPFTNRIKKIRIVESATARTIEAEYKDFSQEGEGLFPADASISVLQDKTHQVKLKWSKININDPLEFPFNIPSGYLKD